MNERIDMGIRNKGHALLGRELGLIESPWTLKDVILANLVGGCGAEDLEYVFEGRGLRVLPTFAVSVAGAWIRATNRGIDLPTPSLYLGMEYDLLRPIGLGGTMTSTMRIIGLDFKETFLHVWVEQISRVDGETVMESRHCFQFAVTQGERETLGDVGYRHGSAHPTTKPDYEVTFQIDPRAHLIYRLSLSLQNNLIAGEAFHVDPATAAARGYPSTPIHGPVTQLNLGRVAVKFFEKEAPGKIVSGFGARFRTLVYPGDVLTAGFWKSPEDSNMWSCSLVNEAGKPALDNIWFRLA
ncbi:MAG: hypothetical protein M9924_18420 [Rhizobiaceae bacterium]|nr:hypothetical protein [Rhizobiaceae bacterium]